MQGTVGSSRSACRLKANSGPGHPAGMSKDAVFPNRHLAKGPVNVNANHASHASLPLIRDHGSSGRHDTYGSALTAQPGESQRRPATNASSQLIVRVGLSAPSCSRRLCPGWSHHTPQSILSQRGRQAPPSSYRLQTLLNVCMKSSSGKSKRRPCCRRRTPLRCCSGLCSRPARS